MTHPWVSVDRNSKDGQFAIDIVKESDPSIGKVASGILKYFLWRDLCHRSIVESWEKDSKTLLNKLISPARALEYEDNMTCRFPIKEYPSIVGIVLDWQLSFFENDNPPKLIPCKNGEADRYLAAFSEARRLCPGLRSKPNPRFAKLYLKIKEAKKDLRMIEDELYNFMNEVWGPTAMASFDRLLHDQFPESDIELHEVVLSQQYPLCLEALEIEEEEF